MTHLRGRDLALLVGLAAIWGVSFMFISLGLDHFSPFTFAALRFDITFLFLLGIALVRGVRPLLPQTKAQWTAVIAAGSLMTCTYHAFLFWGQDFTTPAVAAVIVGLSPVLTTIFSHLLLRDDRLGVRGVLGHLDGARWAALDEVAPEEVAPEHRRLWPRAAAALRRLAGEPAEAESQTA